MAEFTREQIEAMVDEADTAFASQGGEVAMVGVDWISRFADLVVKKAAKKEAEIFTRYRFLIGYLIEKKVLTNQRYSNGTWVLRGVYGVDDSGIKGAGRSAEEAIDNAIIAHGLDEKSARTFWEKTHEAIRARSGDLK